MLVTKLQQSKGELRNFENCCNMVNSFYSSILKELQDFKESFDIALAYSSEELRTFLNSDIIKIKTVKKSSRFIFFYILSYQFIRWKTTLAIKVLFTII